MEVKIKSKKIVPHSEDCWYRDGRNPWSGILDKQRPSFFGNWNAKADVQIGRDHLWYVVVCNCPQCPARKAVHSSVLVNA